MDHSHAKVRADVACERLLAMGFAGDERTVRRAVAEVRAAYRAGHRRAYRPWIPEPGMWLQYDWGFGPVMRTTAVTFMNQIVIALLGGLGGAVVTAVVALAIWRLQARQQRRENKAAARLVWMEITSNIAALNAGMSISPPRLVVDETAWRAHADSVANLLNGAALIRVVAAYATLASARLAFSEVDFQETIRARLHGTDYETLKTLKERFLEAEQSLRSHVWPSDVGERLAEALTSVGPHPSPHGRRVRLMAVALTIGLERVAVAIGWTQLLIRLDYLIERTAIRPAKPWWPRRLAAWLARWVWTRLKERL